MNLTTRIKVKFFIIGMSLTLAVIGFTWSLFLLDFAHILSFAVIGLAFAVLRLVCISKESLLALGRSEETKTGDAPPKANPVSETLMETPLTFDMRELINPTVDETCDRREVRKADLLPLVRPEGWVDPYPGVSLDTVIAAHLTNQRVYLKAGLPMKLIPKPFLLRVPGEKPALFQPQGRWKVDELDNGKAVTWIEAVHYKTIETE